MKKLLIIATALGLSTAAMAADLPKKNAFVAPSYTDASLPFFVGINAGGINNSNDYTLGLTAGANVTDFVIGEVAYDHLHDEDANQVTGNVIVEAPVGSLKPYVLGGVGYRWAEQDEAVWNVGVGTKVALTNYVDFDLRYRHVVGFETEHKEDIITGGLVFNF